MYIFGDKKFSLDFLELLERENIDYKKFLYIWCIFDALRVL